MLVLLCCFVWGTVFGIALTKIPKLQETNFIEPCKDFNLFCPAYPACKANASCAVQVKELPLPSHFVNQNECKECPNCLRVWGNSMNPTIQNGNYIETVLYKNQKLSEGDIIVFKPNTDLNEDIAHASNDLTIHRIYALYEKYLITKGDNNLGKDKPIKYSQIEYVVKKIWLC